MTDLANETGSAVDLPDNELNRRLGSVRFEDSASARRKSMPSRPDPRLELEAARAEADKTKTERGANSLPYKVAAKIELGAAPSPLFPLVP